MHKIVRFLGQKKFSAFRIIIVTVAVFLAFFAFVQAGIAIFAHDYTEVPAYITDVSSRARIRKFGPQSTYTYTVHYEFDGQEYTSSQMSGDKPPSDISRAWVSDDNEEVTIYSPYSMNMTVIIMLSVSVILFIIWGVLYKRAAFSDKLPSDIAVGVAIGSFSVTVVAAIFIAITAYCIKEISTKRVSLFVNSSLCVFSVLAFVISLSVGILAIKDTRYLDRIGT